MGLIFILLFNCQDTVTATTYKLTARENGPYGNILASGFKANTKYPGKDKVIAVSRDLLKKFPFHSYVDIRGAGSLNGVWRVEDVMNRRFKKKIDFLIDWKSKPNKFYNVIIKKYEYKNKSNPRSSIYKHVNLYSVRTK